MTNRIIPVFIPHAGCPQRCIFCDQVRITGVDTPVGPEQVRGEILAGIQKSGTGCELAFYGGSFTALKPETQERLLGAAEPFLRSGELSAIRLSTRPDAVDGEVCRCLRDYGVSTVELGCQSMDPQVLELSRRGHGPEDVVRATELLHRWGFRVIHQMMTGLPGDRGPESIQTARELIALKPEGARIYPTVVLRGTELERRMMEGTYTPQTVEEAVTLCGTLYEMFLNAGIPVIRVGLNPTDDLSGGEAVAGAYHPALGELVLSELYLRRAGKQLVPSPDGILVIHVHPRRVSVMTGQRRRNIAAIRSVFGFRAVKVIGDRAGIWDLETELK